MTATFRQYDFESRDAWLAWRRQGVGGSDVASICGLSTFGSPTSVYYDKVGLAPEQPENEAMRWGKLLEAPIAAEFTVETYLHVIMPQLLAWDDEHPWRRATLDGLVVESPNAYPTDALGTIQIKTTRDPEYDEIPDRIALQCQYELGVAQLEHCWLAVLHGGQKLRLYELEADPLVFERLAVIVDRFYCEHVLAKVPPPADSNPATTDALKRAWNERADGSTVTLDDDLVHTARQWLFAKESVRVAEQQAEFCENQLRAALGESIYGSSIVDGEGLVELISWKPQRKAGRLSATPSPDAEEVTAYRSPDGTTRVLRPTKALKALVGAEAS